MNDNNDTFSRIVGAAEDNGWHVVQLRAAAPITAACALTHDSVPNVQLQVHGLAVRPHFTARLLVSKRERATYRDAKDVLALLRNPEVI